MDSKFNSWVWKINGVIILIAGIATIFIVGFSAYEMFLRYPSNPPEEIINLAEDPEGIEKWTLNRGEPIQGTNTLMLSLTSENDEVESDTFNMFSDSRYSSSIAKNILFLDMSNNQSIWLFNSTSQLILLSEQFPYGYQTYEKNPVTKILFHHVVNKDSNNDGVLNYQDSASLAITKPDGTDYTVIIEEFERIIARNMVGENQVMIVFQNNGIGYSMLFDISTFKEISINELPKVNNS
ncbi:MAG: hypothetical protein ACKE8G_06765 [Methylophagaceae bacterium]